MTSIKASLARRFSDAIETYDLLADIDRVVCLFSGGKDATFGLRFLIDYLKETSKSHIEVLPILVAYPQHVYREDGRDADCFLRTKEYWKKQDIAINIFESSVPDLSAGDPRGCKGCKMARKELVDGYLSGLRGDGKRTAIFTGYTLYDALAYLDEFALLTDFGFSLDPLNDATKNRVLNCLHKIKMSEKIPSGERLIRPLLVFKEDEIAKYLADNEIPYVNRPCVLGSNKHKRLYFQSLLALSDANNATYEGLLGFLTERGVQFPETFSDIKYDNSFTDC